MGVIMFNGRQYTGAGSGGGGGGSVTPNPPEAATAILKKLGIDNTIYGISNIIELTEDEWDALPSTKLTDNILYIINDAPGAGGGNNRTYSGTAAPAASLGRSGDAYIQYRKTKNFTKMRLTITANKGGGYTQLSQITLKNSDKTQTYSWGTSNVTANKASLDFGANALIDGSTSTKFCSSGAPSVADPLVFVITLDSSNLPDSNIFNTWEWYTANDASERDPYDFKLEIIMEGDTSETWIEVDSVTHCTGTTDRYALAYTGTMDFSSSNTEGAIVIDKKYSKIANEWIEYTDSATTIVIDGEGSDVEANPTDPATDNLNTIRIGETIYNVKSFINYSTTEQLIGAWIDSSPLYQKTIVVNNIDVGYDNTVHTSIIHNISNLKEACSLSIQCPKLGICSGDAIFNDGTILAHFRVYSSTIYATGGNNHFEATADRYWYFTIQYTKTTD